MLREISYICSLKKTPFYLNLKIMEIDNPMSNLEKLNRIGIVATTYYDQEIKTTRDDFKLWIDSLKEPMKSTFEEEGFDKCKGILNFKRFCLELQDYGMESYMKEHLSKEDYSFWVHQNKD
jgi:hypothetical protein